MVIKNFKYKIVLPFYGVEDSFKKQEWCNKNFKSQNWKLEFSKVNFQDWAFVHEKDAFQFTLRWG
jgi:hypothetical protein